MIQIKPYHQKHNIKTCKKCNSTSINSSLVWQGIHVCEKIVCQNCDQTIYLTLPIGHTTYFPIKIDMNKGEVYADSKVYNWLSYPLYNSLKEPIANDKFSLTVEIKREYDEVIIINCLDYLYGHSLLKLLNAERENNEIRDKKIGVIVLIQNNFKWMVPEYVDEIWSVNLPFNLARNYYLELEEKIKNEFKRFSVVNLSQSYSHPSKVKIKDFTKVDLKDSNNNKKKITYIWREDRLWIKNHNISRIIQKYPNSKILFYPYIYIQKNKIVKLFSKLRKENDEKYEFVVAGFGSTFKFPEWISDERFTIFDDDTETNLCKIYSQSMLVIGIHGSNMLLPSAHAKMTLNLMPKDRWGNFSQDILYDEKRGGRLQSYEKRYVPAECSLKLIHEMVSKQLNGYEHFIRQMTEDIK